MNNARTALSRHRERGCWAQGDWITGPIHEFLKIKLVGSFWQRKCVWRMQLEKCGKNVLCCDVRLLDCRSCGRVRLREAAGGRQFAGNQNYIRPGREPARDALRGASRKHIQRPRTHKRFESDDHSDSPAASNRNRGATPFKKCHVGSRPLEMGIGLGMGERPLGSAAKPRCSLDSRTLDANCERLAMG